MPVSLRVHDYVTPHEQFGAAGTLYRSRIYLLQQPGAMGSYRSEAMSSRSVMASIAVAVLATGHAGPPSQAGATRQLGCPAFGYTMRVPGDWHVAGACSARATATDREGTILAVVVERHARWSDDQARRSIAGDARALGLIDSVFYQPLEIDDHLFLFGISEGLRQDPPYIGFEEMETFAGGQLYKIAFTTTIEPSPDRLVTGTGTVGSILASLRIAAPGPPPPIPTPSAQQGVSSPRAPGVAVVATHFRVDRAGLFPPPTGQKYVVTRVTVTNIGTSTFSPTPFDFSVVDGRDGVSHDMTLGDHNIIRTEAQVPFLAPGRHETFDVAFAVPIGETSFTLYWEPQFQPPKVRVPLDR